MSLQSKSGLIIGVAVLLVAGIAIGMNLNTPTTIQAQGTTVQGQGTAGSAIARYTVQETDGISLIVTDNQKNTVFFYTVDQDAKPGADLHLRGSIDLNSVGQTTIKPTLRNPTK